MLEYAFPRETCVPLENSERSPLHDVRQHAARPDGLRRENVFPLDEPDHITHSKSGGARRDRTDDLLLAKQALSQLSYGPI